MPTSLSLHDHSEALAAAGSRLLGLAVEAGDRARVATCPAWDARALVAHQTMVHRWATAHLTGADPGAVPSQTRIRRTVDDLHGYYADGLRDLLAALAAAPAGLAAMVFLNDAPPAREFWARRQAHETTVHMVDALSARLGRVPTAREAALDRDLALDGIDELLAGFFTRGRSKLYDGEPFAILVAPDDSERRWHVQVGERLTIAGEPATRPDVTIAGAAAAIYLGLWNRGDELALTGDPTLLDRWRRTQRVRWS